MIPNVVQPISVPDEAMMIYHIDSLLLATGWLRKVTLGASGNGTTIAPIGGGVWQLNGGAGFTASMKGELLFLNGWESNNNGGFIITTVVSATQVQYVNAAGSPSIAAGAYDVTVGSPYPGTVWWQSRGSDGLRNIVFGLAAATGTWAAAPTYWTFQTNNLKMLMFGASDINDQGQLVGGNYVAAGYQINAATTVIRGYGINDASTAPFNVLGTGAGDCGPETIQTRASGTGFNLGMCPRTNGLPIEFWASADLNSFQAQMSYGSNGATAQGYLFAGIRKSVISREIWKQARARVDTIALALGNQGDGTGYYDVTLDRNIDAALKDANTLATDPHAGTVLFQAVAASAAEVALDSGFAMVERVPYEIVTGISPVTIIRIGPVGTVGRKLWKTGKRYDKITPLGQKANNLVGDIVSVCSEAPTVIAMSRYSGGDYNLSYQSGYPLCQPAWRNNGSQRATVVDNTAGNNTYGTGVSNQFGCLFYSILMNDGTNGLELSTSANNYNDPSPGSNRAIPFVVYVRDDDHPDFDTTGSPAVVPVVDKNGSSPIDFIPNVIFAPKQTNVPNRAIGTREGKLSERYRFQGYVAGQGMGSLGSQVGSQGDGSREYQTGIRGNW